MIIMKKKFLRVNATIELKMSENESSELTFKRMKKLVSEANDKLINEFRIGHLYPNPCITNIFYGDSRLTTKYTCLRAQADIKLPMFKKESNEHAMRRFEMLIYSINEKLKKLEPGFEIGRFYSK